jgi:hypothetical protein
MRLTSRSYAIAFILAGASLFALVLLTNVIIDPEAVLGTGVVPDPINRNDRYFSLVEYEKAADQFDGLVFGSSRAPAIPRAELSRHMGANFANLVWSSG